MAPSAEELSEEKHESENRKDVEQKLKELAGRFQRLNGSQKSSENEITGKF